MKKHIESLLDAAASKVSAKGLKNAPPASKDAKIGIFF